MSETKFTKGEWLIANETFIYAMNEIGTNRFESNIQSAGKSAAKADELKANAHLIAAAPDMYRMLDAIATLRILPTEEKLNELLAKARGEHE